MRADDVEWTRTRTIRFSLAFPHADLCMMELACRHSWADAGDTGGVDGRLMMQVLTPFNLEDESDGCSSSHWFR